MAPTPYMKIFSWNRRGLGGASTIVQLKEELKIHLPDLVFLCETKNKKDFVSKVCADLRSFVRWEVVNPVGLSGDLVLGCSDRIIVNQVITTCFCFEIEFVSKGAQQSCWGVFVYANPDKRLRKNQWEYLSS